MGKYCTVMPNCVLRPAYKVVKGAPAFFSLSIGDNVIIEEDCVVEASVIGSHVHIGKGCVIGKRCVIKDCVLIKDGTVLAPETVVAPFSIYAGVPGVLVDEMPESTPTLQASIARSRYFENAVPVQAS